MTIRLLAGAKRELMDAAGHYESRRSGLGDEFLDEVAAALRRLDRWQGSGPPTDGGYRRCLVRRFPYALIYRPADGDVVVVAIMHMKRRPGSWLRRARHEDT